MQLCDNSGNLQAAADAAQVGYGVHRLGVQGVNGCTASTTSIPVSARQQARQQFYAECTAGFEQLQQRIKAFEEAHAQSVAQAADFVQRVRGRLAGIAQRMNADSFGASRPATAGERSAESAGQDRDAGAEDDEEDAPAEPAVGGQAQGGPSEPEEPDDSGEEEEVPHRSSQYEDITRRGSNYPNTRTNLTRKQFEENLQRDGWSKSIRDDGKVSLYEKDGARYGLRNDARSTDGPTADYYKPGSKPISAKIRLAKG